MYISLNIDNFPDVFNPISSAIGQFVNLYTNIVTSSAMRYR